MLKHYDERTEFPDRIHICATVHPPHPVGGRWSRAVPWRMTPVGCTAPWRMIPVAARHFSAAPWHNPWRTTSYHTATYKNLLPPTGSRRFA